MQIGLILNKCEFSKMSIHKKELRNHGDKRDQISLSTKKMPHSTSSIILRAVARSYNLWLFANAHARLHTTAVRESAALHSGKELYTHSRVFPAGSTPRAFPHMPPSLRRKGPRYLIIYLFSAVYYALFIALCCDHRYRSHVHVRT